MRNKVKILLLLLLGLAFYPVCGAAVDSLQTPATAPADSTRVAAAGHYEDNDFAPGLAIMAFLMLSFILACIGAGIVLTVVLLAALFGLACLGIVSASVFVGLQQQSLAKGFSTFVWLASGTGGGVLGAAVFAVLNEWVHWVHWGTLNAALLTGAGCGVVAGVAFGQVSLVLLKRLARYLESRAVAFGTRK